MQDSAQIKSETLALLKLLAIGNREVEEGRTSPLSEVSERLHGETMDLTEVRARTRPYDAARYLRTEEQREAYLEAAQETGDPRLVAVARANVARARSRP